MQSIPYDPALVLGKVPPAAPADQSRTILAAALLLRQEQQPVGSQV
jgi:hypothetical protein